MQTGGNGQAMREILADLSSTCEGCERVGSEPWPMRGNGGEDAVAYRCFAPGPKRGRLVGINRFDPWVPAWCPLMQDKGDRRDLLRFSAK